MTGAVATERFSGFPAEGIQFFLDLQAEQSRTWFKAHQDEFARLWRRPLELFVAELQQRLVDEFPGIAEAEPHLFRIQRDTRFARDRAPYKTNVAAHLPIRADEVRPGHPGRVTTPGLYVSFGLDGEYVACGAWHMEPEVLQRFRAAVDNAVEGADAQALVDTLRVDGFDVDSMERLKRVPAPYGQDHPRAELLKHKGLAVSTKPTDPELSTTPQLLDWAEARLRAAAPLMRWLDRVLA